MLLAYIRDKVEVEEFVPPNMELFNKTEKLARRYDLDLSDALQLVSVKNGKYKFGVQESQSILISADNTLVEAARKEGLKAWNCQETLLPPN